jgi:Arc/MetJ-type ribon-helix-helix transcriptional regulator
MPGETSYPVRKMVSISEEMAKAIEEYRWQNRISSEAEVIRQLLQRGLDGGGKVQRKR